MALTCDSDVERGSRVRMWLASSSIRTSDATPDDHFEVVNLLNRRNAGSLDPQLEYPTSDRPRIVEKRDQSIPRFPTLGLRFRLEPD